MERISQQKKRWVFLAEIEVVCHNVGEIQRHPLHTPEIDVGNDHGLMVVPVKLSTQLFHNRRAFLHYHTWSPCTLTGSEYFPHPFPV